MYYLNNTIRVVVALAFVLAFASNVRSVRGAGSEPIGFAFTPLADDTVAMIAIVADEAVAEGEVDEPTSLIDAITGGAVKFNIRARAELVDQDRLDTSQAYTLRTRLGYGTLPFQGVSVYIEFEDIRAADDDRYNAAGLNSNPGKAVIADPEDTELNQAFIKFEAGEMLPVPVAVIGGRQRIVLNDARFVGNVGWRQNEQTFDAIVIKVTPIENLDLLYGYIGDVNVILGPDASADLESDSHIVDVAYTGMPCGTIVVFGYFLDFDNSVAASSDTYGVRFTGKQPVEEEVSVNYAASIAHQENGDNNPTDYDALYYMIEGSITCRGMTAGAGFEVLGSDNSIAAFATPLATLHRFNGWADVFLATPVGGLEDTYLFVGGTLPGDIKGKVIFHWFRGEDTGGDLGNELDIVASKAISKHVAVLAKFASYDGKGSRADRTKFWLQVEVKN